MPFPAGFQQSEVILGRRRGGGKRCRAWLWFLGLGVGKKCRLKVSDGVCFFYPIEELPPFFQRHIGP
ncbi:TPA: hypothetical protein ACKN0L_001069, partial [Neisseria gonorrhoeae]